MSDIVIIEDNPHSARLASRLLRRAGHETRIAEDGEIGLSTVFNHTPDLILIDLGLPDIDGQTVVAMLRQQPEFQDLPIVAFTAWPEETAQNMATAYGCVGVISKPINTRKFADQVEAFLRKADL